MDSIFSKYTRQMVKKAGEICKHTGGARILNIGLGGGIMPSYLLDNCAAGTSITSVEKDARIISMAAKFFGVKADAGKHNVEHMDASDAVQRHVDMGDSFDVVLIDCFGGHGTVPDACSNQRFIYNLKKLLKPKGRAIQQVWTEQQ